jgi:hypothetical protein
MHTTPGTHDALGALRTRRLSGKPTLVSLKSVTLMQASGLIRRKALD